MKNSEKKICKTCGEEKTLLDFFYHRDRKVYANSCKKCNSKICSSCGEEKKTSEFYFNKTAGHNCFMSLCKDCNNKKSNLYYSDIKYSPTAKKIFQRRSGEIYRRCRLKKLPYMKKLGRYLEFLWENSKHICYYTGTEMSLVGYHHEDNNAVTVDRIIPKLGYVKGNVVLCTSMANRFKQDMTIDEMILFCKKIINQHEKRKAGQ